VAEEFGHRTKTGQFALEAPQRLLMRRSPTPPTPSSIP
jgi:hypothetical protein